MKQMRIKFHPDRALSIIFVSVVGCTNTQNGITGNGMGHQQPGGQVNHASSISTNGISGGHPNNTGILQGQGNVGSGGGFGSNSSGSSYSSTGILHLPFWA